MALRLALCQLHPPSLPLARLPLVATIHAQAHSSLGNHSSLEEVDSSL